MCLIDLVVIFLERVNMLKSNLMYENYDCLSEGVSTASQTTNNDFASA